MSIYKTANYFRHWVFPTTVERLAVVTSAGDVGKVAHQLDNDSLWMKLASGWLLINSATSNLDDYTPTKSYDGEVIPVNKQRLVYGDFEIIGNLELIGDLVIL